MNKINPFNPNSVVVPSLFAGRTSQVLQILSKLSYVKKGMSASFILSGDRGIGKTALAKLIKYIAEKQDPNYHNLKFLTSYYAVQDDQTFEYVLQTSLNILTDRLPQGVLTRLASRLGGVFSKGKFSFGAFSLELKSPDKEKERDLHLKDQAVSIFTNILRGLEESNAEEQFDGILIVIDEVHNLKDLAGVAMLIRNIATTLDVDNIGRVSFLVLGYPESINTFFQGDPSAKRHFDLIELDCMPMDEAKEVLVKGFKEINIQYDEGDVDNYVVFTGGYPHSIQILGHNVIEECLGNIITKENWDRALEKTALELQTKDFSNMYNFKGKETLKETVLNILAIAGKCSKSDLKEGLGAGRNIYRTMQELRRVGAIKEDKETGEVTLSSMLFRAAILMYILPRVNNTPYLKDLFAKYHKKNPGELSGPEMVKY